MRIEINSWIGFWYFDVTLKVKAEEEEEEEELVEEVEEKVEEEEEEKVEEEMEEEESAFLFRELPDAFLQRWALGTGHWALGASAWLGRCTGQWHTWHLGVLIFQNILGPLHDQSINHLSSHLYKKKGLEKASAHEGFLFHI